MPSLDWANDPVDRLRAGYAADRAALKDQIADGVDIAPHEFATGQGLCFTPADVSKQTDILYFHGGGWIVGSPATHKTLCSWMAHLSGRRVFAAPYRLAPEHRFPAQADDAAAVLNAFAATRDHVILSGDSAGGAMCLWAEAGATQPEKIQAIASLYGAFGLQASASLSQYGSDEQGLSKAALKAMYAHLGCADVRDFQARLSKSGAPLALVKAECDPVADDNDWIAAHCDRAITHILAQGQEHAFLQYCGENQTARAVMGEVCDWLDQHAN